MVHLPVIHRRQRILFETLKLDAGSQTWLEQLRRMEELTLFYDRTMVITQEGSGNPRLKRIDHYIVDKVS